MVKRISIRGKGAEIFFGGELPATPSPDSQPSQPPSAETVPAEGPAPVTDSAGRAQAPNPTGMHASMQERRVRAKPAGARPPRPAAGPLTAEVLDAIWPDISERATITNAFRYTERELDDLADVIYEIGKRHGVRLSKQEVARVGLNAILWDYRSRGDASLLATLALRHKPRPPS